MIPAELLFSLDTSPAGTGRMPHCPVDEVWLIEAAGGVVAAAVAAEGRRARITGCSWTAPQSWLWLLLWTLGVVPESLLGISLFWLWAIIIVSRSIIRQGSWSLDANAVSVELRKLVELMEVTWGDFQVLADGKLPPRPGCASDGCAWSLRGLMVGKVGRANFCRKGLCGGWVPLFLMVALLVLLMVKEVPLLFPIDVDLASRALRFGTGTGTGLFVAVAEALLAFCGTRLRSVTEELQLVILQSARGRAREMTGRSSTESVMLLPLLSLRWVGVMMVVPLPRLCPDR